MDRLTERDCYRKGVCGGSCGALEGCDQCGYRHKINDKLAAYKDTGLSPEEVAHWKACIETPTAKHVFEMAERIERERDAAVRDLERFGHNMHTCRNAGICVAAKNDHSACCDCSYWQWRGPQEAGEGVEG